MPFRETAAFGPPRIPESDSDPKAIDVEEVFAEFKRGVEKQLREDDGVARWDMAITYYEIGRTGDAVCEAALVLAQSQPASLVSRALNWMFAPQRGRQDAFRTVVLALRGN